MYLIKFCASGLFVSIYFLITYEGEGFNAWALFFFFLFGVMLMNKLPLYFRQRVMKEMAKKNIDVQNGPQVQQGKPGKSVQPNKKAKSSTPKK